MHVVVSLGSLAVGTLAALVAASCSQNDRGEPASMLHASITRPPIAPPPTIIIQNPCDSANCLVTDKNPCTHHCQVVSGKAQCGTYAKVCEDRNPCTDNSCNTSTGACVYTPNTVACSDGDECTNNDVCSEGACAGMPLTCDDNNVCTTDSCETGQCLHSAVEQGASCDDQNGCTDGDACNATGVCVGTGGPDCDDGDPCTKNGCTNSACYNDELEAVGTPCLTTNKCLVNAACNADGECTSAEEKNCDDNNPCTVDHCDPDVGCLSGPDDSATCDDGDVCTLNDACVDGVCTPEAGITCQAIDECHEAGECDPSDGICSDPRKPDGEPCENTGTCVSGRCEGGTPDPVGEGGAGGAPAVAPGEGGDTAVGDGGTVSTGAAGETSGGRVAQGGTTATGGRGVVAPTPDAGEEGEAAPEVFKRDPGGCSLGAKPTRGAEGAMTGLLTLLGLGLFGSRRRSKVR
jgi:MYXO-CTERM domain-containing protein